MIQRLSMSKGNIRNVMFLQVHLGLQIQILTLTLLLHQNQMAVTTERGRSIHEKSEGKAVKNHAAKSHTTGGRGPGHGATTEKQILEVTFEITIAFAKDICSS